jgi:tetratricopeptide (TPR) repeat protein
LILGSVVQLAAAEAAPRRSARARRKAAVTAPVIDDQAAIDQRLEIEDKLRIGRDALQSLRFTEAEFAFKSILTYDPRNAEALAGASEAAFESAHYEQALAWAERAVWEAATPHNLTLLGHADAKLGKLEQAKVAYVQALAKRPDDPDLKEFIRRTDAEIALSSSSSGR